VPGDERTGAETVRSGAAAPRCLMVARTLRLPTRRAAHLEVALAHLGAERPDEVVGEEQDIVTRPPAPARWRRGGRGDRGRAALQALGGVDDSRCRASMVCPARYRMRVVVNGRMRARGHGDNRTLRTVSWFVISSSYAALVPFLYRRFLLDGNRRPEGTPSRRLR
jgi:hypothetical protein